MIILALIAVASCAVTAGQGQPAGCTDEHHCPDGFFCLLDVHFCRECLQCSELRRQPPRGHLACVRSVTECGPCLEGYVDDHLGVGDRDGAGCIKPENTESVAWYLWVLGFLLIACLLVCAGGVVVYALRNTDTFRVSTRTEVEAPVGGKPPSAPQPPPYNYNTPYEPVRAASPEQTPATPYGDAHYYTPTNNSDSSQPLVKRVPSCRGDAVRESAGSQNARMFNNPSYVRNVPPPSYDSALSDESDHESPFVPQDEDTMPSPWTPNENHDHNGNENSTSGVESDAGAVGGTITVGGAGAMAGSFAGAVLRRPSRGEVSSPPPNKMRCVEDSNKNRTRDGEPSSSDLPPSPPAAAPPAPAPAPAPSFVINVLNVNALHQRNDVTLTRGAAPP